MRMNTVWIAVNSMFSLARTSPAAKRLDSGNCMASLAMLSAAIWAGVK